MITHVGSTILLDNNEYNEHNAPLVINSMQHILSLNLFLSEMNSII